MVAAQDQSGVCTGIVMVMRCHYPNANITSWNCLLNTAVTVKTCQSSVTIVSVDTAQHLRLLSSLLMCVFWTCFVTKTHTHATRRSETDTPREPWQCCKDEDISPWKTATFEPPVPQLLQWWKRVKRVKNSTPANRNVYTNSHRCGVEGGFGDRL